MDLKKLLASSCRQKILKELSKSKELNVMGLVRRINSTYNETNRNFKILEKEGIVSDQHVGRMRLVRLNQENPRTTILLQVLKTLESENSVPTTHWKWFHFLIGLKYASTNYFWNSSSYLNWGTRKTWLRAQNVT